MRRRFVPVLARRRMALRREQREVYKQAPLGETASKPVAEPALW